MCVVRYCAFTEIPSLTSISKWMVKLLSDKYVLYMYIGKEKVKESSRNKRITDTDCMYLFEGDRSSDIPEYAVHLATGTRPLRIYYVALGIWDTSFLIHILALNAALIVVVTTSCTKCRYSMYLYSSHCAPAIC
jgi:hypothetical protein